MYPQDAAWPEVTSRFMEFAMRHSSPEPLMNFAPGNVQPESTDQLKKEVMNGLKDKEYHLFLSLLLWVAQDPDISSGDVASGVRVGPGARLPRLPAPYPPMNKW